LKITYGKTTRTSATDPEVRKIRRLFDTFRKIMRPGAYLVESIPWLKYLPWYAQDLKQQFKETRELYLKKLHHVKEQIVCMALAIFRLRLIVPQQNKVDIGPSFVKYMLEHDHLDYLTESEKVPLIQWFFYQCRRSPTNNLFLVWKPSSWKP
jgi:hypothetical protein